MKKVWAVLLILATVCCLGGCSGIGIFADAQIGPSEKFTHKEIAKAVRMVRKNAFDDTFIYRITYDEEKSEKWIPTYQFIASPENTIVLYADFYTGNTENGLNPRDVYTDYSFILTREGPGKPWKIVSSGYA